MSNHGTPSSRQIAPFVGACSKAAVLVAERMSVESLAHWADRDATIQDIFRGIFVPQSVPPNAESKSRTSHFQPIPEVNEIFHLTLDPAVTQGLALLREFGVANHWWNIKTVRHPLGEPLTRLFKLVSVGDCTSIEEVASKCKQHGLIPRGEFIDAFRKKYRRPDGGGYIGVADPHWIDSRKIEHIPYLSNRGDGDWFAGLSWTGESISFSDSWRWLVELPCCCGRTTQSVPEG